MIDWKICEQKFIRKVESDNERVKSIIEKAMLRLKRAKNTKANSDTISLIVEDYYEVIKELLVAYLLNNNLRSKNHKCLIAYFYKENSEYEEETNLIYQMLQFRNRLNYYGESIPEEFYKKNKENFEKIIDLIKKLNETLK